MNKKKGFTLVEIIIVLVILAILAAIATPLIIGYVDDANDSKYITEGRNVLNALQSEAVFLDTKGRLSDKELMNIKDKIIAKADVDGELVQVITEENYNKYIAYFAYKIKDKNKYVVYDRDVAEMKILDNYKKIDLSDPETMNTVTDTFRDFGYDLDSTASLTGSAKVAQVEEALLEKGVDLKSMGIKYWKFDNKNKFFYWTIDDITNSVGKRVPIMRFNLTTGTFTVWTAPVVNNTLNGITYPFVKVFTKYDPSTSQTKDQQTYENMLGFYNEAKTKYPF